MTAYISVLVARGGIPNHDRVGAELYPQRNIAMQQILCKIWVGIANRGCQSFGKWSSCPLAGTLGQTCLNSRHVLPEMTVIPIQNIQGNWTCAFHLPSAQIQTSLLSNSKLSFLWFMVSWSGWSFNIAISRVLLILNLLHVALDALQNSLNNLSSYDARNFYLKVICLRLLSSIKAFSSAFDSSIKPKGKSSLDTFIYSTMICMNENCHR